jgi:hypothetical protein
MKPRLAAALAMILIASDVFALTGAQYLPQAKVQLVEARKLALKACCGEIVSEELEQEPGGIGLRYSLQFSGGGPARLILRRWNLFWSLLTIMIMDCARASFTPQNELVVAQPRWLSFSESARYSR